MSSQANEEVKNDENSTVVNPDPVSQVSELNNNNSNNNNDNENINDNSNINEDNKNDDHNHNINNESEKKEEVINNSIIILVTPITSPYILVIARIP